MTKNVTVSTKAQDASCRFAELTAKNLNPHTEAENLILPACCAVAKTMSGFGYEKEIKKKPYSNDIICRRICDMSVNIEDAVVNAVKESKVFSMQVDETTGIRGEPLLMTFIRYVNEEKITEQFLYCKELKKRTTGKDVFAALTNYLEETDFPGSNPYEFAQIEAHA